MGLMADRGVEMSGLSEARDGAVVRVVRPVESSERGGASDVEERGARESGRAVGLVGGILGLDGRGVDVVQAMCIGILMASPWCLVLCPSAQQAWPARQKASENACSVLTGHCLGTSQ